MGSIASCFLHYSLDFRSWSARMNSVENASKTILSWLPPPLKTQSPATHYPWVGMINGIRGDWHNDE